MSTPEQPPQLTRRQLRELRNTAATPVIPDTSGDDTPAPTPLPRAAEPIVLADAPSQPAPEATVIDAGNGEPATTDAKVADRPRLTRREVRQRERLRTASVPVITADVLAAAAAEKEASEKGESRDAQVDASEEAPAGDNSTDVGELEVVDVERDGRPSVPDEDEGVDESEAVPSVDDRGSVPAEEPETSVSSSDAEPERRTVAPALGSELLRGHATEADVPASFDQLLSRGSAATGALSVPNALILSQTPEGTSLVAPVTATGEVLITGTFSLPERYGSTGSVPGRSDGADADAVLIDGELPAASSPTPIAASSAISTIKSADEIIKPPAPEKGSRLMVVLAITAGVLAVALAGVLILAITTGVFS